MTLAAAMQTSATGLDEAVVEAAEIVAGHDGAAELLVRLRHGNGASSAVTLDPAAGFDLLRAAGADSLSALAGRPWRALIRNL
jgi:hypothetical protein